MTLRLVLGLAVAAIVVAIVAVWASSERRSATQPQTAQQPLFPGLAERLDDVERVRVLSGGEAFTIERQGGAWSVLEKGGFPASFEVVSQTLLGLAALEKVEAKTRNAALYSKLGLEDPSGEASSSVQLTLEAAADQVLATVIIGNMSAGGAGRYVRLPGDPQSWEVHGELQPERMPLGWLRKDLLKLESARVRSVNVEHADGEVVRVAKAEREDPAWLVQDVPAGSEPISPAIGRGLAAALESFSFDDVRPRSAAPTERSEPVSTVYETFDGLRLQIDTAQDETGQFWASVAVAAADPSGEGEAAAWQQRLGGWFFQVPEYRAKALRKRMTDLVRELPPEEPAEAVELAVPVEDGG
ncbi:MAG: DUF4340 domain-containing protein [Planctomycetota bacterium]